MTEDKESSNEPEEPPSSTTSPSNEGDARSCEIKSTNNENGETGLFAKLKSCFKPKNDTNLRETIEEYIDSEIDDPEDSPISDHEKTLLSNVLELHTMYASDVMIPRVDIIGVSEDISKEDLFNLLGEKQFSRYPVYKDTLDNIVGSIHIKDIISSMTRGEEFNMSELIRDIPIISPSMHVLNLLTQMRLTRKHQVLVVDEFGGIDGLITIGDLIESIVGEIDDEHNLGAQPEVTQQIDGSLLADARFDVDEFEEQYGNMFTEEERQEAETLGGLMFFLAQRVPARGEMLTHSSGMVFEILDADPRRVKQLRIRNVPTPLQRLNK